MIMAIRFWGGKLLLLSILTLAVLVMLSATPARATGNVSITRTFNVAADGYMHEGMLERNHGDCTSGPWAQLKIEAQGGDPARPLLRFDLSPSIPIPLSRARSTTLGPNSPLFQVK